MTLDENGLPVVQLSPLGQMLSSPGMAMASQAANNLSALNRGRLPNRTAVDAMRQASNQNQIIQMQRAEMIDRQLRHKEAMQIRAQQLALQQQQAAISQVKPQLFKTGNNVVAVHPLTGESQVMYEGPEDWQVKGSTSEGFSRISPTTGQVEQLTGPLSESGFFKGTSMHSQGFNRLLKSVEPERREAVALELVSQSLGKPTTYTDASGTSFTQPGIDVQAALNAGLDQAGVLSSGVTIAEPEPTQGERQAYGFYQRMQDAERRMQEVFANYPDFDPAGDLKDYTSGKLSDYLGTDTFKTEAWQLYDAALNDWVGAKLRKESGAAIGDEEKASEILRYFPRYGSARAKRVDLERSRLQALEALRGEAGRAYEPSENGLYFSPISGIVTEDDIRHTMSVNDMTRKQVFEQLEIDDAP